MASVSRETSSTPSESIESANEVLRRIFGDSNSSLGADLFDESERMQKVSSVKFPRPRRTRIIAVANQKGGVGKTTTAVNLSSAFAEAGMKVLVLDMDPQGNASTALGIEHSGDTPSVYDVIEGRQGIEEVIQVCPDFKTLDVVPSNIDLSGAELEISTLPNRTDLLKNALDEYLSTTRKKYDYIFIDCAPSLGLLVLNALKVAEEVLIPIQAEYYALEGLGQLLKTIQLVQSSFNPDLEISMMLVTMYDRRTSLSREVYEEVQRHYPSILLKATIPRAVRISEAPSFAQSIIAYDGKSSGAIAYREAALEIARRGAPVKRSEYEKVGKA
ncbi:MAG: AAA family ATPase [Bifidobacteriaceae bacterium]|nr:AAA family ATPase [Bifidobacteriaceae bacterium]MCI1978514.1 AAA family ATPase [Bifidobacteriaceae bacterium]